MSEADAVVAILTEESVKSEWVMSEISAMLAYSEEQGRVGVLPVWFDQAELPDFIKKIQAIKADKEDLYQTSLQISRGVERLIAISAAKAEKRNERRELLERVASEFIEKSQKNLRDREKSYRRQANLWYLTCCATLIFGAAISFWRAGSIEYESASAYSLLEVIILGVISVGLTVGVAKFSFTLGKANMVEALRNADRSHAITFGEFYLRSYGSESEWSELKDAFQHWNIDAGSAFKDQRSEDFDPRILENALAIAKILSQSTKQKK